MYTELDLMKYEFFYNLLEKEKIEYILDPLTKLVSKGRFLPFIDSLIKDDVPFTLGVIDLDNFKFIVDNYGHYVGDEIIAKIADDLAAFVGDNGLVGRFGGDEFIFIYFDVIKYAEVHDMLSELYRMVFRKNIKTSGLSIFVTATTGTASYPIDANTTKSLFDLADKTLFRGKMKGRNCYIIYVEEKHKDIKIQPLSAGDIFKVIFGIREKFASRLLNEGFRIDHVRYRNLKEGHLDSKIMALENGSDWKKSKYSVLLNLLYYKVTEDSYLINELFKTGDKALSINPEDPYWIDEKLDLALMELRDEINDLYEHRDKIDWIYTEFLKVAPFDYNSHQSNGMINQNTAEYRVYENTYSDAKLFVRDTNLTRKQEEKYTVGKIIQERAFIDSTPKIGRMTTSHRYAILSNHIKDLSEYEKETDWSLHTTAANSQFKILDVYEYKGKTQILLLHLINGFSSVFEDNWTIKKEFVENAREIFEKSFEKEVIESVNSEMWLQRCEFPIGLDPNDNYWPIENF